MIRHRVFAFVFAAGLLATPLAAQQIDISPDTVLAGEPVRIVFRDMPRDSDIQVTAERAISLVWMPGQAPVLYRSQAVFRSNHVGSFDLATAQPRSGSYDHADLRGLFWSLAPVADEADESTADTGLESGQVRLTATGADGEVLASATLTLIDARPEIETVPIGDAFPGAVLAMPPGQGRRPAIILLGGSEGGDFIAKSMAPRLASHGYAVFGLPYYAPPYIGRDDLAELPSAFIDIPVDRLAQVRDWLAARDDIDADRIGIYGVSKGAEFALLAGTRFDWLKAVAAIVPTDVVWEGWGEFGATPGTRSSFSWNGEPLPFVPYRDIQAEFMRMASGGAELRRPQDHGRADHPERAIAARIPVETIAAPVLVAGGMQDAVWASGPMAQNIAESRAAAGRDTVNLVFYDAGHDLSGNGWSPTTQGNEGPMKMGGTPAGTAAAQHQTWQATLAFFRQHLQTPAAD